VVMLMAVRAGSDQAKPRLTITACDKQDTGMRQHNLIDWLAGWLAD
jgi:hypothetical protein